MNATAIINIARSELGMQDDSYRMMLQRVTGKASLRAMSAAEKQDVLDEMKRLGFKVKSNGRRASAKRADVRYCHVLWRLLVEAGVMTTKGARGLNAFIRSRFEASWGSVPIDIDTMTDARQISDVIEALKTIARRHGIPTEQAGAG